jgi:hypothetical protein
VTYRDTRRATQSQALLQCTSDGLTDTRLAARCASVPVSRVAVSIGVPVPSGSPGRRRGVASSFHWAASGAQAARLQCHGRRRAPAAGAVLLSEAGAVRVSGSDELTEPQAVRHGRLIRPRPA